jgi:hypothetical protein
MATLDIRDREIKVITEIKFDSSLDRIIKDGDEVFEIIFKNDPNIRFDDLDDFIAACQKAKELWHNK